MAVQPPDVLASDAGQPPNQGAVGRPQERQVGQVRPRSQSGSRVPNRGPSRPVSQQQQRSHLGAEVKRHVGDRSSSHGSATAPAVSSSDAASRPIPRSRAAAAAIAASQQWNSAEEPDSQLRTHSPTAASFSASGGASAAAARSALAEARELHREGRDEEAVDILVEWLDGPPPSPQDTEMNDLLQAMVALGCWLCNNLATRHLHARRVARAFGYTTTCERWLCLRQVSADDSNSEDMWARLRYDRALNAAELAQSSGDRPKAIALLRECERLQAAVPLLPDPEAAHLCLAEVLLQSGRHAEAATAAVRATQLLRRQPVDDEERKVYGLLFALSLEQAALAALGTGSAGSGPPRLRALRCLPDAEAAWQLTKPSDEGVDAARTLLHEMRTVHGRLLQRAASAHHAAHAVVRSKSAPQKSLAETTMYATPSKSAWTSPSNAKSNPKPQKTTAKSQAKRQKQRLEDLRQLQGQMRSLSPTEAEQKTRNEHSDVASICEKLEMSAATWEMLQGSGLLKFGNLDWTDPAPPGLDRELSSLLKNGSRNSSKNMDRGSSAGSYEATLEM